MKDDCLDPQNGCDEEKEEKRKIWDPAWILWGIGILLLLALLWSFFSPDKNAPTQISYSNFREQIRSGNVASVTFIGDKIQGQFLDPLPETDASGAGSAATSQTGAKSASVVSSIYQTAGTQQQAAPQEPNLAFVTYSPTVADNSLLPLLEANGVEVNTTPQSNGSMLNLVFTLLPFAFLMLLGMMMFRRTNTAAEGTGGTLTKSRARLYDRSKGQTTFDDVAGALGAKAELQEVVEYLRDPGRFQQLGAQIPRGVLLIGPPGTGKTLLARAVAGEADVSFFSLSGSDFMEVFVGVGASRVRDLFAQAKRETRAIIFIDELDSIGRRRGGGMSGNEEREQTLNQLLSEMDGFERNQHVIVMAATNRPDILDPALRRPGRFDREVTVDTPTTSERLEILNIHARNKPLAADVDLDKVARGTPGFSGADLANLLNEAALLAARKRKLAIDTEDIIAAQDKVLMGLARNLTLTEDEARLIAYHESGHAVVAAVLPNADPVHKVTIIPRGRAMGVTQQLPERDRYLYSQDFLLDYMAVIMGGRAAEEIFLDTMTTGAEDDLKRVTNLARKMVLDWGMSDRLGHAALGAEQGSNFLGEEAFARNYSETTAREIDEEVQAIVERAHARARQLLIEHTPGVERLVSALLEKEQVLGDEVLELLELK